MDDLEIRNDVVIPGWELWFTASRSGGPGGQHANTSSSRVTLHWVPEDSTALTDTQKRRLARALSTDITNDGELHVSSAEERSQHRNRELARERMAEKVREAIKRKKRRKKTKPPRWAKRKRVKKKRRRGRKKELRNNPDPAEYN